MRKELDQTDVNKAVYQGKRGLLTLWKQRGDQEVSGQDYEVQRNNLLAEFRYVDKNRRVQWKRYVIWDEKESGLGLRISPDGKRTFILSYWDKDKKRKRLMSLGDVGALVRDPYDGDRSPLVPLTLDRARDFAAFYKVLAKKNGSPQEDWEQIQEVESEESEDTNEEVPKTMTDLKVKFTKIHSEKKSEKTQREYGRLWDKVLEHMADRPVAEITWQEIGELHGTVGSKTPVLANRMLSVLSKSFKIARNLDWYPRDRPNPASDHDRFNEEEIGKALSLAQLNRFSKALDQEGDNVPALAVRFLSLCGCRPKEVLTLRWDDVDEETDRILNLSGSKTGKKTVYLGSAAAAILSQMRELDLSDEWVFPSPWKDHRGPMFDLKSLWRRVQKNANLKQFRLYDAARHTFITLAQQEAMLTLDRVKPLAGHKLKDITVKYTHVSADFRLEDADRVCTCIDIIMRQGPKKWAAKRKDWESDKKRWWNGEG